MAGEWNTLEWERWEQQGIDGEGEHKKVQYTAQGNPIDPRTPKQKTEDTLAEIEADTFAAWLNGVEPEDFHV